MKNGAFGAPFFYAFFSGIAVNSSQESPLPRNVDCPGYAKLHGHCGSGLAREDGVPDGARLEL
jgi:hypothetical protein